jgi:oligopeptidase B
MLKFEKYGMRLLITLSAIIIMLGCNHVPPPIAEQIRSVKVVDGISINDPWRWLENTQDPKAIAYLNEENDYSSRYFKSIDQLKNRLVREFGDQEQYSERYGTIPILQDNYFYYARISSGKDFPVHYRKLNQDNANEEIIVDENMLANGAKNFRMNIFSPSPDNSCYFYSFTAKGNPGQLKIKSLINKEYSDSISNQVCIAIWNRDSKSIIYVTNGQEVFIHKLNSSNPDIQIFKGKTVNCNVDIKLSVSGKYILITCSDNESNECFYLPADLSSVKPVLIDPMKTGRRYFADHFNSNYFLIMSSQGSGNQNLYKAFITSPAANNWSTVIESSDSIFMDSYTVVDQKYLLLFESKKLDARLRIVDLALGGKDNQITFREPSGTMSLLYYNSPEHSIAFSFSSLLTPVTVYYYNIKSKSLTIHRRPVVKDYQKENYIPELLWAKAADGVLIPISVIHKNGMKRSEGDNPLVLDVFGSYGLKNSPAFNSREISLLDHGFYLAYALVRGGGELGNKWWVEGKLMNKKNAVTDYITCAEFLIKKGYTAKGMIAAMGAEAGGIVVVAALNDRPDLFKTALLINPLVDPVSELLDSTKNTNEKDFLEFGSPKNSEQFQYLYSYSPYDNVKKQDYPSMLFRTCFNNPNEDNRGPLKMVAKLRATSTGKNIILIKGDDKAAMDSQTVKERELEFWAENWAFILKQFNIEE